MLSLRAVLRRRRSGLSALCSLLCLTAASGCATTQYYEREPLVQPCMQIDADGRVVYIRNKMEAAREGAFGGFGGGAAGSCGCQ